MGLRDRIGGGAGPAGGGGLRGGSAARYKMQEKMFSIGDDAWIEDDSGNRAFKADGKALRMRSTFVLEDVGGNEVASIQEKMLHIKDTMEIERGGSKIATVKKALISPLRDRFDVSMESGSDWDVQGNILAHEYEITSGRDKVAEVSMKWFRVRDTYGIEVQPGQDAGLVLAVAVALDEMRRGE
jgi:uncharacterized protein YxjI